eukprot:scaffold7464_cov267-Chaetoceros_neogracile.AAC.1
MQASSGLEDAAPNSLDVTLYFSTCQALRCLKLDRTLRLKASFINSSLPAPFGQVEYDQELLQFRQKPFCSQALCPTRIAYNITSSCAFQGHFIDSFPSPTVTADHSNLFIEDFLFFCGNFLADTQFYHLEHIRACPVIKYTTVEYMEDAKEEVNKKAKKEERLLGLYLKTNFSHQGKIITFLPWKLC